MNTTMKSAHSMPTSKGVFAAAAVAIVFSVGILVFVTRTTSSLKLDIANGFLAAVLVAAAGTLFSLLAHFLSGKTGWVFDLIGKMFTFAGAVYAVLFAFGATRTILMEIIGVPTS